jgi:hypothetical protein
LLIIPTHISKCPQRQTRQPMAGMSSFVIWDEMRLWGDGHLLSTCPSWANQSFFSSLMPRGVWSQNSHTLIFPRKNRNWFLGEISSILNGTQ